MTRISSFDWFLDRHSRGHLGQSRLSRNRYEFPPSPVVSVPWALEDPRHGQSSITSLRTKLTSSLRNHVPVSIACISSSLRYKPIQIQSLSSRPS
jgi:hypothetical protein